MSNSYHHGDNSEYTWVREVSERWVFLHQEEISQVFHPLGMFQTQEFLLQWNSYNRSFGRYKVHTRKFQQQRLAVLCLLQK